MFFKRALPFILIGAILFGPVGLRADEALVFIVNAENPIESLKSSEVREYFLKRKRKWPSGATVRFIDRAESPERSLFLSTILKKSVTEIDQYWIGRKLYSGDSAPIQSPSNETSIQFVSSFKDALGYIDSAVPLTKGKVKAIRIIHD